MNNKQITFNQVLIDFKNCFASLNVIFHLHCGTALGAIRDNKFIEWDSDIDVGVFYNDFAIIDEQNLFVSMNENNFSLLRKYGNIKNNLEYTFKHNNGVCIDIFCVYTTMHDNREKYYVSCHLPNTLCKHQYYEKYIIESIQLYEHNYMCIPPHTLIDLYGDDWNIPKIFNYKQGIEEGHYKNIY